MANGKINIKEIADRMAAGNASASDIEKVLRAIQDVNKRQSQIYDSLETPEDIDKYFKEQVKLLNDNSGILKDVVDVNERIRRQHQDAVQLIKERIDDMIESGTIDEELLKKYKELYKLHAKLRRHKDNYLKSVEKGAAMTEQMLQATLGLVTEWQGIGARGFLKGFVTQLKRTVTFSNVLATVASGFKESVFAFDTAQAELFKQTGMTRERFRLLEATEGLDKIGTQIPQKVMQNVVSLRSSLRSFDELGESNELAASTSLTVLTEMGVSQQAAADAFVFVQRTLRKTPEQARHTLHSMSAFAREIGRSPNEVVSEFAQAAPVLAMYGNQSEKIFKALSREAQSLNMEVREILSLSLTMDSFEGAAKAAQNFNLAFGGPFISAQALMAASVEDRYDMIADAYRDSGKKLSRREVSGLAKDMGLNEQKLMQILNKQKARVATPAADLKTTESMMAEDQELIKKNLDFQTTILASLEMFYRELVSGANGDKGLRSLLSGVVTFLEFIGDNFGKVLTVLGLIKVFEMASAARGATPLNPTFTASLPGGKFGAGLTTALVGTAAVGAIATNSYMANQATLDTAIPPPPEGGVNSREDADMMSEAALAIERRQESQEGLMGRMSQQSGASPSAQVGAANPGEQAPAIPAAGSGAGLAPYKAANTGTSRSPTGTRSVGSGATQQKVAPRNDDENAMVTPGGVNIRLGSSSSNMVSKATTTNKSATHITPVFNKMDKFYPVIAAKSGGDIISSLEELHIAVKNLLEWQKNAKTELSIEGREFYRAVKNSYSYS